MTNYLKQYCKTVKPRYRSAYGNRFVVSTTDKAVKLVTRKSLKRNYQGRYTEVSDGKLTSFIWRIE